MDVGARIAQLRSAYGLSQYALWKRSGIAQGALSQYESGAKTPSVDTLERICDALGITLADFFSSMQTNNINGLNAAEADLLSYFRSLSPSRQQDVLLILRTLSKAIPTQKGTP